VRNSCKAGHGSRDSVCLAKELSWQRTTKGEVVANPGPILGCRGNPPMSTNLGPPHGASSLLLPTGAGRSEPKPKQIVGKSLSWSVELRGSSPILDSHSEFLKSDQRSSPEDSGHAKCCKWDGEVRLVYFHSLGGLDQSPV
jgi:hypothetical protein